MKDITGASHGLDFSAIYNVMVLTNDLLIQKHMILLEDFDVGVKRVEDHSYGQLRQFILAKSLKIYGT